MTYCNFQHQEDGCQSSQHTMHIGQNWVFNHCTTRVNIVETCSASLMFESVDEILWCDHSNETTLTVLLHGNICFTVFYNIWDFS